LKSYLLAKFAKNLEKRGCKRALLEILDAVMEEYVWICTPDDGPFGADVTERLVHKSNVAEAYAARAARDWKRLDELTLYSRNPTRQALNDAFCNLWEKCNHADKSPVPEPVAAADGGDAANGASGEAAAAVDDERALDCFEPPRKDEDEDEDEDEDDDEDDDEKPCPVKITPLSVTNRQKVIDALDDNWQPASLILAKVGVSASSLPYVRETLENAVAAGRVEALRGSGSCHYRLAKEQGHDPDTARMLDIEMVSCCVFYRVDILSDRIIERLIAERGGTAQEHAVGLKASILRVLDRGVLSGRVEWICNCANEIAYRRDKPLAPAKGEQP